MKIGVRLLNQLHQHFRNRRRLRVTHARLFLRESVMKRVLFSVVALSVPFAVQALADEYRLQPGDVVEIGVANYAASGMSLPGATGLIVKVMLHR